MHRFQRTAAAAAAFATILTATAADAQTIRTFTKHPTSGHLYEVITGSNTGGRFVYQPRSTPFGLAHGYTDRASLGEWVFAGVTGTGVADQIQWLIRGQVRSQFARVPLPFLDRRGQRIGAANQGELAIRVRQSGRMVEQRIPVGRRP